MISATSEIFFKKNRLTYCQAFQVGASMLGSHQHLKGCTSVLTSLESSPPVERIVRIILTRRAHKSFEGKGSNHIFF